MDSKGVEGWQLSASSVLWSTWTLWWVLALVGVWCCPSMPSLLLGFRVTGAFADAGTCAVWLS